MKTSGKDNYKDLLQIISNYQSSEQPLKEPCQAPKYNSTREMMLGDETFDENRYRSNLSLHSMRNLRLQQQEDVMRNEMTKFSMENDQSITELNHSLRHIDKLNISNYALEQEIASWSNRFTLLQNSHQQQLDQLKIHFENLMMQRVDREKKDLSIIHNKVILEHEQTLRTNSQKAEQKSQSNKKQLREKDILIANLQKRIIEINDLSLSEIERLSHELRQYKSDYSSLQYELDRLRKQNETYHNQILGYEKSINEMKSTLALETQQSKNTHTEEIRKLNEIIQDYQMEVNSIETRMNEHQKSTMSELAKFKKTSQLDFTTQKKNEIHMYQQNLMHSENQIRTLQVEIKNRDTVIHDEQSKYQKILNTLNESNRNLSSVSGEYGIHMKKFNALEFEYKKYQSEIQHYKDDIMTLDAQKKQLNLKLLQFHELLHRNTDLQDQINQLNEKYQQLQQQMNDKHHENNIENQRLKLEIQQLRLNISDLEHQLQSTQHESEYIGTQHNSLMMQERQTHNYQFKQLKLKSEQSDQQLKDSLEELRLTQQGIEEINQSYSIQMAQIKGQFDESELKLIQFKKEQTFRIQSHEHSHQQQLDQQKLEWQTRFSQMKSEFETNSMKYEQTITQLKNQNNNLTNQLNSIQIKIDQSLYEQEEKQIEFNNQHKLQNDSHDYQVKQLETQISNLKNQQDSHKMSSEKLVREKDQKIQTLNEDYEMEILTLNEQLDQLQFEYDEMKNQLNSNGKSYEKNINNLSRDYENQIQNLNSNNKNFEIQLHESHSEHNSIVSQFQVKIENYEVRINQIQLLNMQLEKDVSQWSIRYSEIEEKYMITYSELQKNTENMSAFQMSEKEWQAKFNAQKSAFESEISKLERQNQEFQMSSDHLSEEIKRLDKVSQQRFDEIQKLKLANAKSQMLESELLELYSTHNDQLQKIQVLESDKLKFTSVKNNLDKKIRQLEDEFQIKESELEESQSIQIKLKTDYDNSAKEVFHHQNNILKKDKLRKELNNHLVSDQEKDSQLVVQSEKISDYEREIQDKNHQIEQIKQTNKQMEQEINRKQQELQEQIQELDLIKAKYENSYSTIAKVKYKKTKIRTVNLPLKSVSQSLWNQFQKQLKLFKLCKLMVIQIQVNDYQQLQQNVTLLIPKNQLLKEKLISIFQTVQLGVSQQTVVELIDEAIRGLFGETALKVQQLISKYHLKSQQRQTKNNCYYQGKYRQTQTNLSVDLSTNKNRVTTSVGSTKNRSITQVDLQTNKIRAIDQTTTRDRSITQDDQKTNKIRSITSVDYNKNKNRSIKSVEQNTIQSLILNKSKEIQSLESTLSKMKALDEELKPLGSFYFRKTVKHSQHLQQTNQLPQQLKNQEISRKGKTYRMTHNVNQRLDEFKQFLITMDDPSSSIDDPQMDIPQTVQKKSKQVSQDPIEVMEQEVHRRHRLYFLQQQQNKALEVKRSSQSLITELVINNEVQQNNNPSIQSIKIFEMQRSQLGHLDQTKPINQSINNSPFFTQMENIEEQKQQKLHSPPQQDKFYSFCEQKINNYTISEIKEEQQSCRVTETQIIQNEINSSQNLIKMDDDWEEEYMNQFDEPEISSQNKTIVNDVNNQALDNEFINNDVNNEFLNFNNEDINNEQNNNDDESLPPPYNNSNDVKIVIDNSIEVNKGRLLKKCNSMDVRLRNSSEVFGYSSQAVLNKSGRPCSDVCGDDSDTRIQFLTKSYVAVININNGDDSLFSFQQKPEQFEQIIKSHPQRLEAFEPPLFCESPRTEVHNNIEQFIEQSIDQFQLLDISIIEPQVQQQEQSAPILNDLTIIIQHQIEDEKQLQGMNKVKKTKKQRKPRKLYNGNQSPMSFTLYQKHKYIYNPSKRVHTSKECDLDFSIFSVFYKRHNNLTLSKIFNAIPTNPKNLESILIYVMELLPISFYVQREEELFDFWYLRNEPTPSEIERNKPRENKFIKLTESLGAYIEIVPDVTKVIVSECFLNIVVYYFELQDKIVIGWTEEEFEYKIYMDHLVLDRNEVFAPSRDSAVFQRYWRQIILSQLSFEDKLILKQRSTVQQKLFVQYIMEKEKYYEEEQDRLRRLRLPYFSILQKELTGARTLDKIEKLGKQASRLFYFYKYAHDSQDDSQLYEIEWLFVYCTGDLIITIYNKTNTDQRLIYRINKDFFNCRHLNDILSNAPETIEVKLQSTFELISNHLIIDTEPLRSNFAQLDWKTLFYSQYASKINVFMRNYQLRQYYLLQLKSECPIIRIRSYIEQQHQKYIRIDYSYHYKLNQVYVDLAFLERQSQKHCHYINLQDLSFLYDGDTKLNYIQYLCLLSNNFRKKYEYFKNPLQPIIDIIHKELKIHSNLDISYELPITPYYRKRPTEDEVHHKVFNSVSMKSFYYIIRLQSEFRKRRMQNKFSLQKNMNEMKRPQKKMGRVVKRKFIKMSDISSLKVEDWYILYMYSSKQADCGDEMYFVNNLQETINLELYPYQHQKGFKIKGYELFLYFSRFQVDHSKSLYGSNLNFYESFIKSLFYDEGVLRLRDFRNSMIPFKDLIMIQNIVTDVDQKEDIIQQPTRPTSTTLMNYEEMVGQQGQTIIYNVVFSGQPTQVTESQQNTVIMDVKMSSLQNLYPNIKMDANTVNNLGQQLIKGLDVNQGTLVVDTTIIKPMLCNIRLQNLNDDVLQKLGIIVNSNKQERKRTNSTILAKRVTFYCGHKYLIVIYQDQNDVESIVTRARDEVFESVTLFYRILGMNLSQKCKDIEWIVSPEEFSSISSLSTVHSIAKNLINRISMGYGRFIFPAKTPEEMKIFQDRNSVVNNQQQQVICIHEKALIIIQREFKNRAVRALRLICLEELKEWKDSQGQFLSTVYFYGAQNLNSKNSLITLAGETPSRKLVIIAWPINSYQKYQLQIVKKDFVSFLLDLSTKRLFMQLLVQNNIFYGQDGLSIYNFNAQTTHKLIKQQQKPIEKILYLN